MQAPIFDWEAEERSDEDVECVVFQCWTLLDTRKESLQLSFLIMPECLGPDLNRFMPTLLHRQLLNTLYFKYSFFLKKRRRRRRRRKENRKNIKTMTDPGLDPGTSSVLDSRHEPTKVITHIIFLH